MKDEMPEETESSAVQKFVDGLDTTEFKELCTIVDAKRSEKESELDAEDFEKDTCPDCGKAECSC